MIVQPIAFFGVPPAPTLDPLTAVDSTTLSASFSRDEPFDNYEVQLYLDEALTIFANGAGPSNIGSSVNNFNTTVGDLSPGTQYWGRARVSADGGITQSAWSNTDTGTTDA